MLFLPFSSFLLIGIFIGSFLGVLVDRIPKRQHYLFGRSHCDSCQKTLAWFDLIPLLSYVFLGGKCRYCHKPIGGKFIMIEIGTGIMFSTTAWIILQGNIFLLFTLSYVLLLVYSLAITSMLLVIFFTDLFYGIIPDIIIVSISVLALLYTLTFSLVSLPSIIIAAFAAFLFFIFLFAITKGRGMGFGDVKFAFCMGLLLGWPRVVVSIYLAFLTGAIVALILILWKRKKIRGSTLPFGPFLVLGTYIGLYFGDVLVLKVLHFL